MESKSRYEVIAELEAQKQRHVQERDELDEKLARMHTNLEAKEKQARRDIEDINDEIEQYKRDIALFTEFKEQKKETLNELIKSKDETLKSFTQKN